jgi:hypothetical protein
LGSSAALAVGLFLFLPVLIFRPTRPVGKDIFGKPDLGFPGFTRLDYTPRDKGTAQDRFRFRFLDFRFGFIALDFLEHFFQRWLLFYTGFGCYRLFSQNRLG